MSGVNAIPMNRFRSQLRTAVLLAVGVLITLPKTAFAEEDSPSLEWTQRPYKVQLRLGVGSPRILSEHETDEILRWLDDRIELLVSASWLTTIASAGSSSCYGATAYGTTEMQSGDPPPEAGQYDKSICIDISLDRNVFTITAREWDAAARLWGSAVRRRVTQPQLLPWMVEEVVLQSFAPVARMEILNQKESRLRLRAGGLPLRDSDLQFIPEETVFLPVHRRTNSEGHVQTQIVPHTLLRAVASDGDSVTSEVYSSLRSPFALRSLGRTELIAVAVRAVPGTTSLRLTSNSTPPSALEGFEVFAAGLVNASLEKLGMTDRSGRISITAGPRPLRLLYIKHGARYLARLPIIPGRVSEIEFSLSSDQDRLRAEGWITSFHEQLVDVVARREVLIAGIEASVENSDKDQARKLLDRLKQLPGRYELMQEMRSQRQIFSGTSERSDPYIDRMLAETETLITTQFDPERIGRVETDVLGLTARF